MTASEDAPWGDKTMSHSQTTGLAREEQTLALLAGLEQIAAAGGIPFDRSEARRQVQRLTEASSPTSAQILAESASSLGLNVRRLQLPLRQLLLHVASNAPAIFDTPRGAIIIFGASGNRVQIVELHSHASPKWTSLDTLIGLLGLKSTDDEVQAMLIHSQLSFESLRGSPIHNESPVRRLLSLLRTESRDVLVVIIYAIAVGILSLSTPLAVESLVNSIAFGGLIQPLLVVSALLFASLAFVAALRVMQTIIVEFIQRRLFVRMTADLAYRLPRVDMGAYDAQHGPELVNRFFDVLTVQKVASTFLLEGVGLILTTLIGASLLAAYHPYLLLYDFVLVCAMCGITLLLGRGAITTSIEESRAKYAVADCLEEFSRIPNAYKLGVGPEIASDRADDVSRQYVLARSNHFRIVLGQVMFALILQALASTVLLSLGGWLVIAGQLTLGQLVAAELIVTVIIGSFAKIGKHLESFYDLVAAIDKLGHLMDLPLEVPGNEESTEVVGPVTYSIHHVDYRYEGSSQATVMNLTVDISSGSRWAIIGDSGSGKSTLIDLLQATRLPNNGTVLVNGVDTRLARREWLRRRIGVVRDLDLVKGTVLDNLRMGRSDVTAAEISDVLESVGLLDVVSGFPDAMRTIVQPGGSPFSRGEAYRLVLARAMLGHPVALLIDGTLDLFDEEMRARLLQPILNSERKWTTLIVTHCADVIRRCDYILTLLPARGRGDKSYAIQEGGAGDVTAE